MNVFKFDKPVVSLQWNPVLSLLTVATGSQIVLINSKLGKRFEKKGVHIPFKGFLPLKGERHH
jgi:hypothetical protein